jgi:protein-S-isoprenylcysteine O-methyltransferase Ste14
MYIGVFLVVMGEALLFRAVALGLYATLLWSAFHLFVVFYEEPTLRRQFGESYEEYRRRVPRWIPKLRR